MAANDDEGVLITRGSVRRIGRAVARVESSPASGPGGPSGAAVYNPGVQRARVTTAIPTGTESSPSSAGAVRLKVRDAAGAWVDGETVQVLNDFSFSPSIPVGRMVRVAWVAGQWWLVSASCS